MSTENSLFSGMHAMPAIESDPFDLARSLCSRAVEVARDVSIDDVALRRFVQQLDVCAVKEILHSSLGENCDTDADEFRTSSEAANFAVLFSLLQFGHGFRYELHRLCGRGASRTVTLGVRTLHATGDLSADRLTRISAQEIRDAFGLPGDPLLEMLAQQFRTVVHQAGTVLESLGLDDFAALCVQAIRAPEAATRPAATVVRHLANHFPAFNDQGLLHDGSRVVLLKKATLAVGELRRLAAPHDPQYQLSADFHRTIATVDNVIPAVLVYRGVLRLSPALHQVIHEKRTSLASGPQETELRAVALAACERMVAEAGGSFTALELGYYLWRSGKDGAARQFPRHHTKDTIFY